ncbi:hypothetical protein CB1_000978040 [Camelus ferus]|nr:hypothetical protein CB1_000978040 [Camelus ferus]
MRFVVAASHVQSYVLTCSTDRNLVSLEMVKDDYEDDAHVFRKAANDITSQLEINFGNLPRPGRGARGGTRGGRGRVRRAENYGPRAEVVRRQQKQGAGDIHNVPQGKSAEEARGLCIWACTRGKPFQIRVPVPDPFDVLGKELGTTYLGNDGESRAADTAYTTEKVKIALPPHCLPAHPRLHLDSCVEEKQATVEAMLRDDLIPCSF